MNRQRLDSYIILRWVGWAALALFACLPLNAGVLTIAAVDSGPVVADYYCDGVDDDLEFMAAIASLRASSPGNLGKLKPFPGTYWFSTRVSIQHPDDNLWIEGSGEHNTIIRGNNMELNRAYFQFVNHDTTTPIEGFRLTDLTVDSRGDLDGLSFGHALIQNTNTGDILSPSFERLTLLADADNTSCLSLAGPGLLTNDVYRDVTCEHVYSYGLRVHMPGFGTRMDNVYVTNPDPAPGESFNNIAVYAGRDDIVVTNSTSIADHENAHSPIGVSPGSNARITGNYVRGSARTIQESPPGECGIEFEWKGGHGGDGHTPTNAILSDNIVVGANYGICTMSRTSPFSGPHPVGIIIDSNILQGNNVGVFLHDSDDVLLGRNLFRGNLTDCSTLGVVTFAANSESCQ